MKNIIENAWNDRSLLDKEEVRECICNVIDKLDKGELRIAEKVDGKWIINEWLKKAVLMYFPINKMEVCESGIFEYYDKIPLKRRKHMKSKKIWKAYLICLLQLFHTIYTDILDYLSLY